LEEGGGLGIEKWALAALHPPGLIIIIIMIMM